MGGIGGLGELCVDLGVNGDRLPRTGTGIRGVGRFGVLFFFWSFAFVDYHTFGFFSGTVRERSILIVFYCIALHGREGGGILDMYRKGMEEGR